MVKGKVVVNISLGVGEASLKGLMVFEMMIVIAGATIYSSPSLSDALSEHNT